MTVLDATIPAAQTGLAAPAGKPVRFVGEARFFWHLLVRGAVLLMFTLGIYRFTGLSLLLGDFVGGGAVVLAGTTILKDSYTREVESAADLYGVTLMDKIGGDARALGTFLQRIDGRTHPGMRILRDHPETNPETKERVSKINAAAAGPTRPLLDSAEWAALKRICSGG